MFIELYPLKQIVEHALVADNISLNLIGLETLGSLFECEDDEAMKLLEKIEEPWTHLIHNFIKPFINSMNKKNTYTSDIENKSTICFQDLLIPDNRVQGDVSRFR